MSTPLRLLAALGLSAAPGLVAGCASFEDSVRGADVVFVGESHDERWHHEMELEILDVVAEGGPPVLLGMEMFQRPFQRHLDDYVAGEIGEEEMLRRTEYFSRWRFDYTLYAPLWRRCREIGARVVALNAPGPIVTKVGREGLGALSQEERGELAEEIDLGVASHRERILAVFRGGAHPMPEERLEKLYEAQTVWDETMAESAARALAEAPEGARMVVVAGSFHVHQRDGIPDRFSRRMPGAATLVVVLRTEGRVGDDEPAARELGDEVLVLPAREESPAPKLGVEFDVAPALPSEGLPVTNVVPGGTAAEGGMLAGDVLVSLAGAPVHDLTSLRYTLDVLRVGDVVAARVLRAGTAIDLTLRLLPAPTPPTP